MKLAESNSRESLLIMARKPFDGLYGNFDQIWVIHAVVGTAHGMTGTNLSDSQFWGLY